jgi:ligand-binding SRPBCC domain-containing protein
MPGRELVVEKLVPLPRDAVFAFLSEPLNLEVISPPWLSFRIVGHSTPEDGKGTELTDRIRIHGIPVTWRSRIDDWRPNDSWTSS